MSWLMTVLAAVAGVYLSMRCIAALYRIIDVGYALRREQAGVVRGLLTWFGMALVLWWVLPPSGQRAFEMGLLGYAGCHVVLVLLLTRVALPLSWRRARLARSTLEDRSHAHAARRADGDQAAP